MTSFIAANFRIPQTCLDIISFYCNFSNQQALIPLPYTSFKIMKFHWSKDENEKTCRCLFERFTPLPFSFDVFISYLCFEINYYETSSPFPNELFLGELTYTYFLGKGKTHTFFVHVH